MMEAILQGAALLLSGGGLGALLTHLRKSRKAYDQVALEVYTKVTAEQDQWRKNLQERVDELSRKLWDVQVENATLLRRIAELEAYNTDLQRDKQDLENRVQELEKEVKDYRVKHG